MQTEDGELFIKHVAYYIRTHEKALANALQQRNQHVRSQSSSTLARPQSSASLLSADNAVFDSAASVNGPSSPPKNAKPNSVSSSVLPSFNFGARAARPAKLYLAPNQLYYLLSRYEELGVNVGPLNIRLENISTDHSTNYMSFLAQTQFPKGIRSDQDSVHSVSSVRSAMSSLSSMWSSLSLTGSSESRALKRKAAVQEDIRYLYSAFTKLPCLKLALDPRVRRIAGYEEFPFDTAVPIHVFKNLTVLEVADVDFRAFYGWDRLADQLRSLTVKRAGLDNPMDLITNVVLDDMEKRRKRSARPTSSPAMAYPTPSPMPHPGELGKSYFPADGSLNPRNSLLSDSPRTPGPYRHDNVKQKHRVRSNSPKRSPNGRLESASGTRPRSDSRRHSSSSNSSTRNSTPRHSSTNLLAVPAIPLSKWRLLTHLSFSDNGLTSITTESLCPLTNTLKSFDLSNNLFTEVPDSLTSLVALRALNLSNCMIDSIRSLAKNPLPAITVLNLRQNRLSSLAGIERLLSLERLDVRGNRLTDPTELARLTGMPEFRDVYVGRNPFTNTHTSYRVTIFNLFRDVPGNTRDVTIDSEGPGYSARRQLHDWKPEPVYAPVVQLPFEDENVQEAMDIDEPSKTLNNQGSEQAELEALNAEHDVPKRRKVSKRRMVDLATNVSPSSPRTSSSFSASPVMNKRELAEGPASPIITSRNILSEPDSPVVSSEEVAEPQSPGSLKRKSPAEFPLRVRMPSLGGQDEALSQGHMKRTYISSAEAESPRSFKRKSIERNSSDFATSSETYRKRIEMLKNDHGNNWLAALGNEAWGRGASDDEPSHQGRDLSGSGLYTRSTTAPVLPLSSLATSVGRMS